MQFPNASKLLLMLPPSIILYPLLSVVAALSLPAKSIKHNLEVIIFSIIFLDLGFFSIIIYIMA